MTLDDYYALPLAYNVEMLEDRGPAGDRKRFSNAIYSGAPIPGFDQDRSEYHYWVQHVLKECIILNNVLASEKMEHEIVMGKYKNWRQICNTIQ